MKILIFWCWDQAWKYIHIFKDYKLDIVTEKNKCKHYKNNYFYNNFIKKKIDFDKYKYIIISVFPIENQTKIIKFLINKNISTKIIIEKPVTYDLKLLKNLILKDNIVFNIEELEFSKIFLNIKIDRVDIYSNNRDFTIDHSIGFILLNKTFNKSLWKITFYYKKSKEKELNYKLIINNNIIIINNKWILYLNGKEFNNISLYSNIKFLVKFFNTKSNLLFKYNYFLFKKDLLNNKFDSNIILSKINKI